MSHMKGNFGACLIEVLKHEGGKVNHPKDPGGRTNMGITQKVYDAYRLLKFLQQRSVYEIALDERDEIYRKQYWELVAGDDLPRGVDLVAFDAAVNSGVSRGAKWIQKAVDAKPLDGIIGMITLGRVAIIEPVVTINAACDLRMAFLRGLRTWRTFGKGWRRRVESVRREAVEMTKGKENA